MENENQTEANSQREKAELQILFDRSALPLLACKTRSINENDTECRYRGIGGRKCAVGNLITDENYDPLLEGLEVEELAVREAVSKSTGIQLQRAHLELLHDLQRIHDCKSPIEWASCFRHIALIYGLTPPPT